ncbi:MAG: glycosyltransferase family 4 protein, partial [Spirochaetes bacterium]|nr:glycosyltransferase family 4 protein [Spirochaetota bacterium]
PYPEPMDDWAQVYRVENLNIWSIRTKHFGYEKLVKVLSPMNFLDYMLTRFHIFPEMETFSIRAFNLLSKLLKARTYDIIHDVQCLAWGLLPMKGFGIPIISTVHHPLTRDREADFIRDSSFWEYATTILFYPLTMQKVVINRLDRIITSSREGVEELHKAFSLSKEKISIVYNGLDVDVFRNSGKKREENSLLFVGNTEDFKKGIKYLLEMLALLPRNVRLTIVDEGPPKKMSAFDYAKRLGVAERIEFTGKVALETLVNLYCTKTIVVISSLHEGFGLPAAEGMACETAVVSTDSGALKEVIANWETGILVPAKNPRAMADAVMKLLENKKLREKMGKAGRKRAVELFSWQSAAKNTLTVYEDVIAKYRSGR